MAFYVRNYAHENWRICRFGKSRNKRNCVPKLYGSVFLRANCLDVSEHSKEQGAANDSFKKIFRFKFVKIIIVPDGKVGW